MTTSTRIRLENCAGEPGRLADAKAKAIYNWQLANTKHVKHETKSETRMVIENGAKNDGEVLFKKFKLGSIGMVTNRIAMAPMTRARCSDDYVPDAKLYGKHFSDRADAGLLITDATNISPIAVGWNNSPGIWTEEQVEAWKEVVANVKSVRNVPFVCQLWHTGRASHSDFHGGKLPVSASDVPIGEAFGGIHVPGGEKKPHEAPRPLTKEDIAATVHDFVNAAKNAMEVGFDGVEIHSANGYLLNQFLDPKSNKRTDEYGGSIENRLRFLREVIEAITQVVPADKVGVRFSPNGVYNDMGSDTFRADYTRAIQLCAEKNLAYVHVMDGLAFGFHKLGAPFTLHDARIAIKSVQGDSATTAVIGNCGHTRESAIKEIGEGNTDLIAFGRPYISNPDLVRKFKLDEPISEHVPQKYWYGGGENGYTDLDVEE